MIKRNIAALLAAGLAIGCAVLGLSELESEPDGAVSAENAAQERTVGKAKVKSKKRPTVNRIWPDAATAAQRSLYDAAADLIEVRRLEKAGAMLSPHAEAGDTTAQFLLALSLGLPDPRGKGPSESARAEAHLWMRRAAAQDHRDALIHLGDQFAQGLGTPRDPAQALAAYTRALDLGHPKAATKLGYLYMRGLGVRHDAERAMAYYHRGAEAGDPAAWTLLGYHTAMGTAGPPDMDAALDWTRKAAAAGERAARHNLIQWYNKGQFGRPDPARFLAWMKLAAERGDVEAWVSLGDHWDGGLFGAARPDHRRAFYWYQLAAERGHERAQRLLALVDDRLTGQQRAAEAGLVVLPPGPELPQGALELEGAAIHHAHVQVSGGGTARAPGEATSADLPSKDLDLSALADPAVLILASNEPVLWRLTGHEAAEIRAIFLTSKTSGSRVLGAGPEVPLFVLHVDDHAAFALWTITPSCSGLGLSYQFVICGDRHGLAGLEAAITRTFGRPLASHAAAYAAVSDPLAVPGQAIDAAFRTELAALEAQIDRELAAQRRHLVACHCTVWHQCDTAAQAAVLLQDPPDFTRPDRADLQACKMSFLKRTKGS